MIRMCRRLTVIIAACVLQGCNTHALSRTASVPEVRPAAGAPQTAARPGEDPQTAYRRELLNNQLRHAQLDLQSATSESDRQSIQERINTIQQVLASLE